MNRFILIFLATLLPSLAFSQPWTALVHGNITNTTTGFGVPNYPVYIYSDSTSTFFQYNSTVYTNANGFYADTILVPFTGASTQDFIVTIVDSCNFNVQSQLVVANMNITNPPANFSICGGGGGVCSAGFSYLPGPNGTIHFTDQSVGSSPGAPLTYFWNFDDGGTSTTANPTHTYAANGVYITCLTISDATGCTDTYCDSLFVSNAGTGANCSVSFTAMQIGGPLGASWAFSGTAVNMTFPYYSWDFGDGNYGTTQNPTYTYNVAGTFLVCLTAIDSINNCTAVFCDTIVTQGTGGGSNCSADFYAIPDSGLISCGVSFIDNSGPTTNTWLWDFGDGNSSTLQNPYHMYASGGTYLVTLHTAEANGGFFVCSDSMQVAITLLCGGGSSCTADFSWFESSNGEVQFTDLSIGSSPAAPLSYSWNFGDGGSSTVANPGHTYSANGTYNACLTITDNTGCTDIYCEVVTVTTVNTISCMAQFVAFPDTSATGTTMQFVDQSTSSGTITTWTWDFGDGTTGTQQNPAHTYAANGTYIVCLVITDNSSCSATYCDSVTVGNVTPQFFNLGGMVLTSPSPIFTQPADHAIVYLVTVDLANFWLTAVDSVIITPADSGYYQFTNVPAGYYTAKAALTPPSSVYWNYIPTYHTSELFWSSADYVALFTDQYATDINMIPGANPGGSGFVGGSILSGANKMGGPIEHAEILLLDMADNPIAYTWSDALGEFSFSNLAYGTYKVYAEMMNKTTIPVIVTLSAANPSITGIELTADETLVTSIGESFVYFDEIGELYPNPAQDQAWLDVELKKAVSLSLTISDLAGRTVWTRSEDLSQGNHKMEIETADLPTGMYILKINAGGSESMSRKLIKTRD